MEHFIHYLKRRIENGTNQPFDNEVAPFYAIKQAADAAFLRPHQHISRQKTGVARRIKPGSVIWICSVVESPWGKLGPALDAKIVVRDVEERQDGLTCYHAAEDSLWFPLKDAASLIASLESIDDKQKISKIWPDTSKPLGIYLQSMRRVHNAVQLETWQAALQQAPVHFISYRIKDGTEHAFRHAAGLLQSGNSVYWDRFCLPRRLVERREQVADDALDEALTGYIERSEKVWGIESPLYTEPGCYAQKEADLARSLNKYFSVPVAG